MTTEGETTEDETTRQNRSRRDNSQKGQVTKRIKKNRTIHKRENLWNKTKYKKEQFTKPVWVSSFKDTSAEIQRTWKICMECTNLCWVKWFHRLNYSMHTTLCYSLWYSATVILCKISWLQPNKNTLFIYSMSNVWNTPFGPKYFGQFWKWINSNRNKSS